MQNYLNFIEKLNRTVKYVVSFSFITLAILVFIQVITRFIIDYPLSWSEEISRYLMIYIVFLGSALAMRNQQHISIDFLPEVVSATNKRKLNILILWVCVFFFAILAYYGSVLTLTVVGQATPTLQFSIAWAYAAIPIGSVLMLLNAIAVLVDMRTDRNNGLGGETQ